MSKAFLQVLKNLQPSWLTLILISALFFSVVSRADEALPPLFIEPPLQDPSSNQSANKEIPIIETTADLPIRQIDTSSAPHKMQPDEDSSSTRTEFLYSSTNATKEVAPFTLTPLSSIEQNNESLLDELWKKTLPTPKVAKQKTIEEKIQSKDLVIQDEAPISFEPLPEEGKIIKEAKDTDSIVERPTSTPTTEPLVQEPLTQKPVDTIAEQSQTALPIISIIIDDLGYTRRGMQSSLQLPVEVTLAILPHTPFSKATATASTKQSRTTMLHVPMENTRKLALGPGGLYSEMEEQELKKTLTEGIASVPGITGINNHMGSLLTQDKQSMQWVMESIQPMGLFFVDSLTSGSSVAYNQAQSMGLTSVKRNVFLDNIRTEAAIHKQFERLLRIAKDKGHALAIGHPYPSTMEYLLKHLPALESQGVRLVSINEYMQTTSSQ